MDWLLGNDTWKQRLADANARGGTEVPQTSGLQDVFDEISPITDYAGTMSLYFREPRFETAKYTEDECREGDKSYAAPLFVVAEVGFAVGLRKELHAEIERRSGPTRVGRPTTAPTATPASSTT